MAHKVKRADGAFSVSDDEAWSVCKMGQKADTCRYLTAGPGGFSCGKFNGFKGEIDDRVHRMTAKREGDCELEQ